jgi:hypothetical protein
MLGFPGIPALKTGNEESILLHTYSKKLVSGLFRRG